MNRSVSINSIFPDTTDGKGTSLDNRSNSRNVVADGLRRGVRPSISVMANDLGLSPSEVHGAMKRLRDARLLHGPELKDKPNLSALEEFLLHGVKYAFPAEYGQVTRGVPTSYAAAPLNAEISPGDELPPVWPSPDGKTRGVTLEPLYRTAPVAPLRDAARFLRPLLGELVFVGGCTTALLITNTAAADVRPTYDVDAIAEITSYAAYTAFSERLRNLGFAEDVSEGAPICRWRQQNTVLDVMPLDPKILGFSNRWYSRCETHVPHSTQCRSPPLPATMTVTPAGSECDARKSTGMRQARQKPSE